MYLCLNNKQMWVAIFMLIGLSSLSLIINWFCGQLSVHQSNWGQNIKAFGQLVYDGFHWMFYSFFPLAFHTLSISNEWGMSTSKAYFKLKLNVLNYISEWSSKKATSSSFWSLWRRTVTTITLSISAKFQTRNCFIPFEWLNWHLLSPSI